MKWLATLPTTNFRIFVSIMLAIVFVLVVLAGIVAGKITGTNDGPLYTVGGFLLIMMGLDVTQFSVKRLTHQPTEPPNEPDAEDKPALDTSAKVTP